MTSVSARLRGRGVAAEARLSSYAVAIAFALALSACASATSQTFDLSATSATARGLNAKLTIAATASVDLDSNRIVVRTGADSLAYLAGGKWSERLPALVRKRLDETFQNVKTSRPAPKDNGPAPDYGLEVDIRAFELDISQQQAVVEISARLISTAGGVIAEKAFKATAPAKGDSGEAAAAALDVALAKVMKQIVGFVAGKV